MPSIKLRKIGGSTVATIPPYILDELMLTAGSEVTLAVERGRVVMVPVARSAKSTLTELLAMCDLSAKHTPAERAELDAWDAAMPRGREVIY